MGLEWRDQKGERHRRRLGGETGPENRGSVSYGQDFGQDFIIRAMRKSLHGLNQGSIMIWLTFQAVREHEGRQRAREQAEVDYNHLGRGDGCMDKWRWRTG